ncbi:PEPxxWA-CTERM sorting domain-containing protein [Sandarakinorhabdus sp.]|uniref:PEPxxWA-CTERM sorting domain-containing protein n=1 Tax=Sandarakinorhabdus sp. TaxID=1916663 RepID=UPI00286E5D3E|nr:PEPxxWA-CTERM sorting domain-containing protein [Sandarakinorhabdus sp.]
MSFKFFGSAVIGAALLSTTAASAAPRYRLVVLAPPANATTSVARAISANGQITGEAPIGADAVGNTATNYGSVGNLASTAIPGPAGTTNSFTRGINDSGVAAGTAQNNVANTSQAILASTSGLTLLNAASGFANAGATGINNGGTVVGYSQSIGIFAAEGTARPISAGQGQQTATVWDALGNASTLANPFGNFNSLATAVNAAGQVAGAANRSAGAVSNAVIWNGANATALATLGTERSTARSISSTGWVAGRTDQLSDGSFVGSVWDSAGAKFGLAPVAGCGMSDLRSINSKNTVVGFSLNGACSGVATASLWQWNGSGFDGFELGSLVVNLNGFTLQAPQGINDLGQIVGFGFDAQGNTRGYLLTAVPEPASWAMLICGFGLVGAAARRRRLAVSA